MLNGSYGLQKKNREKTEKTISFRVSNNLYNQIIDRAEFHDLRVADYLRIVIKNEITNNQK